MRNLAKLVGIIAMVAVIGFSMVACEQYDDEKDFRITPLDNDRSAEITEYIGTKQTVRIPPRIQKLPVTTIGGKAFRDKNLTGITIPKSVTAIETGAFLGNPLTDISVASGNTAFSSKNFFLQSKDGKELFFYYGNEKDVSIPNGVTTISDHAFSGKQLTNVTIPDSVTSIGYQAFLDNQLTGVTIPDNVTSIGGNAFYRNQLTSIIIGANVDFDLYRTSLDGGWYINFCRFYDNNGKQAGTYVRPIDSTTWAEQ